MTPLNSQLSDSHKPIICLMGPTASGKSHLAMQLAENLPVKLISVDSALVYRGMDIGTAKPSVAELAKYPHELIDVCDPVEPYSAGRFCRDVIAIINRIHAQNYIPLLVGGTMMYFSVLQRGIASLPDGDAEIRNDLNKQAEKKGWPALHEQLKEVDAQAAARINPQDSQRIQRALEVFFLSGKTLTELQRPSAAELLPNPMINIAIAPKDRIILHQRIADRLENMFAMGFIAEVEKLFHRNDLHENLPSMRTVGYRQIWQYLSGKLGDESVKLRAIYATRQLAKRQFTWLRRWPNLTWFDSEDPNKIYKVLEFLQERLSP